MLDGERSGAVSPSARLRVTRRAVPPAIPTATATPTGTAMATATNAPTATAMTTTAAAIRKAMRALDPGQLATHFSRHSVEEDEGLDDENDENDEVENVDAENNDVEPFQVCDGVSVDAFNEYVRRGKDLRVGVRFLELATDGRLLVVDFPSRVHEATVRQFESAFLDASGNRRAINSAGSMTAHRGGQPHKEADATFGPFDRTPHRTPPPRGRTIAEWITVAVEVGRSQSWPSLESAARWWHRYVGIKFVLLIKISPRARSLGYRLYDAEVHPLGPLDVLPAPVQAGQIHQNRNGPTENITFDARRVLSIPAGLPLPAGVNDQITVDLRDVMTMVIDSLGRR